MSNNLENKLHKFIADNIELVSEYESLDSTIPLEYCESDVVYLYKNIVKLNKNADFNTILKDALKNSIRTNIPITDSLESIMGSVSVD